MSSPAGEYMLLLEQFLSKKMSVEDFQVAYLNHFKKETRRLDESVFELLDSTFGDVDAFTTDPLLLAESPDFYLDEEGLRKKVRFIVSRLADLTK